MAKLTSAIPKEDQEIVEGIAEPEKAWKKLDERYGDRNLMIIAAMSNLTQPKLPAGLAHKKVKALVQGVRLEKARLRAVGGETKLFADSFTVGLLIEKLKKGLERRVAAIQLQKTLATPHQQEIIRQV